VSKPALIEALRNEIAQNGPIPFARFMEQALYHPEHGYYTASDSQIGWGGDYYTSSTLHPLFGELIAQQLLQMEDLLCQDGEPFSVLEMGAGRGTLCGDILTYIQQKAPDVFGRLQYQIIEKSDPLRRLQQARLWPRFSSQATWGSDVPTPFEGVILSNEFVDALPVHRLRGAPASLREIYVDWQAGHFTEIEGPLSSPHLRDYVQRLDLQFDQPVTLEINLEALDWMRNVGRALKRGWIVTIDYGYPAKEIYTTRRARGTLLCYHRHTAHEDPYIHIGEQDMTAHVDFTSLAWAGREVGLSFLGFTDQTHFLMGLGVTERMAAVADQMDNSEVAREGFLAMKKLMAPDQMGKTFKVLIQGKAIPDRVVLDGLRFRPFFQGVLDLDEVE